MSNRKTLLAFGMALLCSGTASAQIDGDGFYRVQNCETSRYMSEETNYVEVIYSSTSVNAAAIRTRQLDKLLTCPSSVIYFESKGGTKYNFVAQAFDIYAKTGFLPNLVSSSAVSGAYRCYGTDSGITVYLSDYYDADEGIVEEGYVRANGKSTRDWYVKKINTSDNYLGVAPSIQANDGYYYQPFYASFAFSPVNASNTKVYYVSRIWNGQAVISEVTGTVPKASPVIIKTTSSTASNNMLSPTSESVTALSGNKLKGVYFCSYFKDQNQPENRTAFDAETMRVLRVQSDGTLAFVVDSSLDYLPANESYLSVSSGSPEVIPVIDEATYTTGITEINANDSQQTVRHPGIYTSTGVKIRDTNDTQGLQPGLYVIDGKTCIVK